MSARHRIAASLGPLLLLVAVAAPADTGLAAAIERGFGWILAHPASEQDGGLPDLVDEVLFYLAAEPQANGRMQAMGFERARKRALDRLASSDGLRALRLASNRTLFEVYHLLLATHLLERAGRNVPERDRVVEQGRAALAASTSGNPTFRLTIALLLQHLGSRPAADMQALWRASMLHQVLQGRAYDRPDRGLPYPLGYYALVHEIAVLTDFGRLPAPPWLAAQRSRLAPTLAAGLDIARAARDVDLTAELLLCYDLLALPVDAAQRRAVDFLLAGQRADGSWGAQQTRRANKRRHAAQTATAALLKFWSRTTGRRGDAREAGQDSTSSHRPDTPVRTHPPRPPRQPAP